MERILKILGVWQTFGCVCRFAYSSSTETLFPKYTANVTINGVGKLFACCIKKRLTELVVHVVLDTGSTDLWVLPPPPGIGTFNDTGIPLELYYGDRTLSVSGTIGVSPFKFGEYTVERQGDFICKYSYGF